MAFVRRKRTGQTYYYQLVENRKVDGSARQKVLVHLGKHQTVEDALDAWSRELNQIQRDPTANGEKDKLSAKIERLRELRAAGVA